MDDEIKFKQRLIESYQRNNSNWIQVAKEFGIGRSTIYRYADKFGLPRRAKRRR